MSSDAPTIRLPRSDGTVAPYEMAAPRRFAPPAAPLRSRVLYAAVHVVSDPLDEDGAGHGIDWEATMAFRRHVWRHGLGVAEAMDTAQRGMGLSHDATRELIRRSCAEAQAAGGRIACGAVTDGLPADAHPSLDQIVAAYAEQGHDIERHGGRVVLMGSRHLARVARGPNDYRHVYDAVLSELDGPVVIHWLGEMFDPQLAGYWGSRDLDEATDVCVGILQEYAAKIDGIKLSLLDAEREVALRRRLPEGVRMYSGDDFHYDDLILGDAQGHSDGLLGIFDAIAPAAASAVAALDAGDEDGYRDALSPTVPFARHVFAAPTFRYKTGLVFLAYLNGHQDHFRMLGGQQSARSVLHLAEAFRLADQAGLLDDPPRAARRMGCFLDLSGVT
ncbi:MAG: dihydrodipicolinate synthase family protein [Trueperaceae bacterium]|nr:dihydrodipicolinate synthase family protein [Trueperaceae bacterium]